MGQKYLIDTNVISHLFANKLSSNGKNLVTEIINADFIISVVVQIETLTFHDDVGKMDRIEEFINLATILPLNPEIAKKAIELRRDKRKLKLGDAIIAATAIIHQLTIITNNTKDFSNIKGLKIIDPHKV